jgi:gliding motility-associated-like protein
MLILNNKNMNTLNKLIVLFFTVFIFIPTGYSQNNADPGIGIIMSPATVTQGSISILRANVGNFGNETIVENSLRVTISVGANAEIIGIASGSDTHWSQEGSLIAGSGNTIKLINSGGDFGSFDVGYILLTVKGNEVGDDNGILGNIVYIAANNSLLCGGCLSPPLNASQGNASNSNDNSQTSLTVICNQGSAPTTLCYQTATFNNTTCLWDVTGTLPAQQRIECYETATFNSTTCVWDVTGDPPVDEVVIGLCSIEGSINLITNVTYGLQNVIDNFVPANPVDGGWIGNLNGLLESDGVSFNASDKLGVYQFTYKESGDCGRTITIFINVRNDCYVAPCSTEDNIEISKVVTANNDGVNDFFSISEIAECGFTGDVSIFNRWGKRVYYSNNYQNNWGGYHDGSGQTMGSNKLPTGTYYYVVKIVGSGYKPITGYIYLGTN